VGGASIEDSQPRYPLPHKLLPEIESLIPCQATTSQRDDILTTWSYRFPGHMDLLVLMGQFCPWTALCISAGVQGRC
jgi:hypothetical protein